MNRFSAFGKKNHRHRPDKSRCQGKRFADVWNSVYQTAGAGWADERRNTMGLNLFKNLLAGGLCIPTLIIFKVGFFPDLPNRRILRSLATLDEAAENVPLALGGF